MLTLWFYSKTSQPTKTTVVGERGFIKERRQTKVLYLFNYFVLSHERHENFWA